MQKSRKHAVLFRCPERRRQCKEVGEQADKRAVFLAYAWYKFDFGEMQVSFCRNWNSSNLLRAEKIERWKK